MYFPSYPPLDFFYKINGSGYKPPPGTLKPKTELDFSVNLQNEIVKETNRYTQEKSSFMERRYFVQVKVILNWVVINMTMNSKHKITDIFSNDWMDISLSSKIFLHSTR